MDKYLFWHQILSLNTIGCPKDIVVQLITIHKQFVLKENNGLYPCEWGYFKVHGSYL
jgi:hypothetical protein